jgi:hypothetical protein
MNVENAVDFVVLESENIRYKYPVEVLEETEDELRVRWLGIGGFRLPNKQFVEQGDIILIPKAALFSASDELAVGPIN